MSATGVLELREVSKAYGSDPPVNALRDVSFTVNEGELVAIVGPSGSGKTTLLHVIGTLERPSSGAVLITGLDAADHSDRELASMRARSIGFVFQQFFLAEHSTALENVADGLLYAGVGAGERRERAAQALAEVGLADRVGFRPSKLSGGERQRVAIARALVGHPAIVLADEPTGSLDFRTGEMMMELIEDLHRSRQLTSIHVTHNLQFARRADRVVTLERGKLVDPSSDSPLSRGKNSYV